MDYAIQAGMENIMHQSLHGLGCVLESGANMPPDFESHPMHLVWLQLLNSVLFCFVLLVSVH